MARRHYVDNAPVPTFGPVNTSDTTWTLSSATGLPTSFPFTATLGLATASQENILVTNVVGTTVTATRNYDSLGAFSHPAGETFTHSAIALDYDEANAHVNASTGVHGVTGAVVGTTDAQTLSNKTFAGLALTANSVVGLTVTGNNTSDLADFKKSSTIVAAVDKDGNFSAQAITAAGAVAGTNVSASGTLGVTGTSTLGVVNSGNHAVTGTLSTSGAATLASAGVTGNATVGGTLGVTGVTTLAAVGATNVTASGTLGVTGASTLGAVTATTVAGRIAPPQYANESARDTAIPSPTAGEVISLTSPTTGAPGLCFEVYESSAWQRYSAGGGTWTSYTPTWANMTIGNATNQGWYKLNGKTLSLKLAMQVGSTTGITTGTAAITASLPGSLTAASTSPLVSMGQFVLGLASGNIYSGYSQVAAGGTVIQLFTPNVTTSTNQLQFTNSLTVGNGSNLYVTIDVIVA